MRNPEALSAMLTLDSARRKFEHARYHFDHLSREIHAFESREPFVLQDNIEDGMVKVRVSVREAIPDVVSLILGDCIHNLRSSLDHVVYEAVGKSAADRCEWPMPTADGKPPPKISWKKYVEKKIPGGGEAPALRTYVNGLDPFKGGKDDFIWVLHRLDIIDKHRLLLTVCAATDNVRAVQSVDAYEVSALDPDDRTYVPNVGEFDVTWKPELAFPLEDGALIAEYTPDDWAKLKSLKVTLSTAIGEVRMAVSGQALTLMVRNLIVKVDALLEDITQRIGSHTL